MAEWQIDIVGAIGELGVAKALGLYWEAAVEKGLDRLPGDVGQYQVRSTRYATGKLIVHDNDADEAAFILAVIKEPEVMLAGWLYGREARSMGEVRQNYEQTEWWVPQQNLRPMSELLEG